MKTPLAFVATIIAVALLPLHAEETSEAPAVEQAASTPSAETAAPAVVQADDAASLEAKVGSEVIVEGVVKDVGKTSGGGINFINFGDRKTGFTAVVFRSDAEKFPEGFDKYANQKVRVRGTLEKYQDRQIQIKVSTPDQLEIVPAAP
jgi:DNA/RNA endonuclease YhcR with UshA esterase domain